MRNNPRLAMNRAYYTVFYAMRAFLQPMIEFDKNKTVAYWINGAKYDLSVANAMLKTKKYPYVLFMAHLALEKLLKGLVVKYTKAHAPLSLKHVILM